MATPDSVLFIVDGALDRPLLHSQGLPLLRRLSAHGLRCYIQSIEAAPAAARSLLAQDLAADGLRWHPQVVPSRQLASARHRAEMVAGGAAAAWTLCRRERIAITHCRSYRPGMVGGLLRALGGPGFVFDMRGFLLDELVADGRWRTETAAYQMAKRMERWMLRRADVVVTTSPQFTAQVLAQPGFPAARSDRIITIPNCVDLGRFRPDDEARRRVRAEHGWEGRLVLLFSGAADRYQRTYGDIARLFQAVQRLRPEVHLACAAYGELAPVRAALKAAGLPADRATVFNAPPASMAGIVAAADVGVAFFRVTSFAHAIASPVKFAEYLAAGLPVVINTGVGDTGRILEQYRVGVTVDIDQAADLDRAAERLVRLVMAAETPARCRAAAEQELSLDLAVTRYLNAYQQAVRR